MLTDDMKRIVNEQRLGFVATVSADGTPNLSPKGTFAVVSDNEIAFVELRSPATVRNLRTNPAVEVNFVDPFVRKGYRFKGTADLVEAGTQRFDALLPAFERYGELSKRSRLIVVIKIARALPLITPTYDRGATEPEIRRTWTRHFRSIQPSGRYVDAGDN